MMVKCTFSVKVEDEKMIDELNYTTWLLDIIWLLGLELNLYNKSGPSLCFQSVKLTKKNVITLKKGVYINR